MEECITEYTIIRIFPDPIEGNMTYVIIEDTLGFLLAQFANTRISGPLYGREFHFARTTELQEGIVVMVRVNRLLEIGLNAFASQLSPPDYFDDPRHTIGVDAGLLPFML